MLEENQVHVLTDPVEELDKPAAQAHKAIFTLELKPLYLQLFRITILSKTKERISHLQYCSVGTAKGGGNPIMSNR